MAGRYKYRLYIALTVIGSLLYLYSYQLFSSFHYFNPVRSPVDTKTSLAKAQNLANEEKLAESEADQLTEEYLKMLVDQKAVENTKRLVKVAWFCNAEEKLKGLPTLTRMYNIAGFNLSITLIAKVASTSWVAFIAKTQAPECQHLLHSPRLGYAELHACVKKVLSNDPTQQPVKALFVRDPWSRLVSVYEDKIVKQRFMQADSCYKRWRIKRTIPDNISNDDADYANLSFAQFITCIIETSDANALDPHYRPQYLMHDLCNTQYTHIGTLEDLYKDFLYVMKCGQPHLSALQLQQLLDLFSGGPRRASEAMDGSERQLKVDHYFGSLDPDSISKLQDIYKWDVLLHSYHMHPLQH